MTSRSRGCPDSHRGLRPSHFGRLRSYVRSSLVSWGQLAALAIAAGCRVETTRIEISAECAAPAQRMNLYAVTLFAVNADVTDRPGLGESCALCTRDNCRVVDEACAGSEYVAVQSSRLPELLDGVGFADIDPDELYCIRVVALDWPLPVADGQCPTWQNSLDRARMCLFSDVGAVNTAGAVVVDHAWCERGDQPFMDCFGAGRGAASARRPPGD